jgi:hypothetical protein
MPHAKPQNKKKKKGYQYGGLLRGVGGRIGDDSNVSRDFLNSLLESSEQSPEVLQALRRGGFDNRTVVPGRFGRPALAPAQKARKARVVSKAASGGLVSRGYGLARSPKGKKYV